MGSRKWYDRAGKSYWCRGRRRKHCRTCGSVPWPKFDSAINGPLDWPSSDDLCICSVLDTGVASTAPLWHVKADVDVHTSVQLMQGGSEGDVLFCSDVGATAMSHDRPLGSSRYWKCFRLQHWPRCRFQALCFFSATVTWKQTWWRGWQEETIPHVCGN